MIQYRREGHHHCVYVHKRKSNGTIFYVGISSGKTRPYEFESRTKLWKNVANKHGVEVVIVADGLTITQAVNIESELIKTIGRICDNTGPLANFKINHFDEYKPKSRKKRKYKRKEVDLDFIKTLKNKLRC